MRISPKRETKAIRAPLWPSICAPKPAAILGIPVGFVGAAESKDALAADPRGVPFLIVRGRIGGSAMTAAAVNALARAGL